MVNNKRRKVIKTAIIGIGASLAGCTSDTEFEEGNPNDDSAGNNGGTEEPLEVLEHELVREDAGTMAESVNVQGRAENVSDRRLSYAEVEARFYNEAGDQLESSLDNTNDLDAGATWAFEIMYIGMGEDAAEVADYDIGVGSNF